RLQHLALEHLHLLLRGLQPLLAEARELEPTLVRGERLLERKLARFHSLDDFFQLGERLLERELARRGSGFHPLVRYCFPEGFTTNGGDFDAQAGATGELPPAGFVV